MEAEEGAKKLAQPVVVKPTDTLAQTRVAIVGGGLSGLATAIQLHLLQPNANILLYEASSRLGGVIQTELVDDFVIDHGADMFAAQPVDALSLCQKLGIDDQLILPELEGRGAMIVRNGRLLPIPDGFVLMRATKTWPMMTTPLLSIAGKLSLLSERFRKPIDLSQDLSVGEFVRQRMGAEVLDRIVSPLVGGIYTADIEKLSMLATMKPISEMAKKYGSLGKATAARRRNGEDTAERLSSGARYNQFRSFPKGMRQLIDHLSSKLPEGTIATNSPVSAIRPENKRWIVSHSDKQEDSFDNVVITSPAKVTARLLTGVSPEASAALGAIESSSAAIVVLAVKKTDIAKPVKAFGAVVPIIEGHKILAISFASHKFANRAPSDHTLIRVFLGGSLQPELLEHDDNELVSIVRKELGDLIGLTGTPTLSRVFRWNESMPQYHVGHLQRVETIESSIAAKTGLHIVSNALGGVGIAPIIRAAGKVAEKIANSQQP